MYAILGPRAPAYRLMILVVTIVAVAVLGAASASAQPSAPGNDFNSRYAKKDRWMFTSVAVTDIDRSVLFYRQAFNMVVKRERRPSEDFAEIFLGYPDDPKFAPTVMLVWRRGEMPTRKAFLALETTDAKASAERARANGGRVRGEPRKLSQAPLRIGSVEDPDGNVIELVQYAP